MSHPSPELILEVNIFERLEQVTNLTLGQLTQLRALSRSKQINLLFIAFQEQKISGRVGQQLAIELGIPTSRAPWATERQADPWRVTASESTNVREGVRLSASSSVTYADQSIARPKHLDSVVSSSSNERSRRRFQERPSLTAAIDYATTPSLTPSPDRGKRSFSAQDLKTAIEIHLPSFMEQELSGSQSSQGLEDQSSSAEETTQQKPKPFETTLEMESSSRWSEPIQWSMQRQFDQTYHTQLIYDHLLKRELWTVSSVQIELNQNSLVPCRSYTKDSDDPLLKSYQRLKRITPDDHLPTIYDMLSDTDGANVVFLRSPPRGKQLTQLLATSSITRASISPGMIFWQLLVQMGLAHRARVSHGTLSPDALWLSDDLLTIERWEWCGDPMTSRGASSFTSSPQQAKDQFSSPPEIKSNQELLVDVLRADVYRIAAVGVWLYTGSGPEDHGSSLPSVLSQLFGAEKSQFVHYLSSALSDQPQDRPADGMRLLEQLTDLPFPKVDHCFELYRVLGTMPVTGLWS